MILLDESEIEAPVLGKPTEILIYNLYLTLYFIIIDVMSQNSNS